jgi:hypothetical protein
MAIEVIDRFISSGSPNFAFHKTYVASTRPAAIASARSNSGTAATDIGRVVQWPQILSYVNGNGTLTAAPPAYIWDSVTTAPQDLFFAISTFPFSFAVSTGQAVIVELMVFCDNAHNVQIDIFDLTQGDLFTTLTPAGGLTDGSLNTGTVENPPFNWQTIRYYSNDSQTVPAARNGDTLEVVISFEAVNYSGSGVNPAGLAFIADIYLGSI